MTGILNVEHWFRQQLSTLGEFLGLLVLRLLLAWEYWESGVEKYNGENWFDYIKDKFPFPFNVIDIDISWFMATWFELAGALAILIGLATRYVSISLVILTIVATIAVHIPPEGWSSYSDMLSGYAISDKGNGNYKLPLVYMIMFVPLILMGPGKFSVDHLIDQQLNRR